MLMLLYLLFVAADAVVIAVVVAVDVCFLGQNHCTVSVSSCVGCHNVSGLFFGHSHQVSR